MAPSTNSLILSLKVVLISIGAVSLAMVAKASIPLFFYELPTIWSAVIAWLKPPYLYFVINGIIFIIVATSRSSNHKESSSGDQFQPLITARTPPQSDLIAITQSELHSVQSEVKVFEAASSVQVDEPQVFEDKPELVNCSVVVVNHEDEDVIDEPDEVEAIVISKSVVAPSPEIETKKELFLLPATEKPLASSRFGNRKPAVKMSPEGVKSLRVARSKKPETLENTWKMITGERHVPLTRHMKKSDTFHINARHVAVDDSLEENENSITFQLPPQHHHHQRHVLKSETFKDRTNYDSPSSSPSPSAVKIRKDPSLSSDELNRRVEAFIKKFNEDMRLQRQQSMQQYMEMINRGV